MGRKKLRVITCHLGNGCSLAAVRNGRCIDTSMGMGPNEGVMMGTRSGSVDISALNYIAKHEGIDIDESTDKERITKMHIRYGKPIYISMADDLSKKLAEYEEAISTMRWELIEEKGLFHREQISNQDYINYLKGVYRNLAMKNPKLGGKGMADVERSSIRGASDDFYLFHHINDVPFNEKGELMETEESIRLARLFDEHILGIK